jgi:hypothetical protein
VQGYKFRIVFAATAVTVIVNATDYDAALKKVHHKYKPEPKGRALAHQFLGECDPRNDKDPYDAKMPKKVF